MIMITIIVMVLISRELPGCLSRYGRISPQSSSTGPMENGTNNPSHLSIIFEVNLASALM